MPARQLHQRSMTALNTGTLSNIGIPKRSIASVLSVLFSTSLYFAIPGVGQAEPAAATRSTEASQHYSIAGGSLASALRSLASSANVLLTFTDAQTAGKTTAGIAGQYTLAAALSALLAGTGMQAVQLSGGGYVLRAAPEVGVSTLPEVAVKASREPEEKATGPVRGYVAKRSATATKTDTPIIETPQSISVVTADQMRNLNAQSLQDALGYTSGLASGAVAMNPAISDSFYLRGFQADSEYGSYYRDGMRFMSSIYNGKQEPYGLERVEVLKGPSSVLYGAAAPGGIINTVSKRPQATPLREINAEVGRFDRKQLSADFSGSLNADNTLLYRLTALVRKSGTYIDHGQDDRVYIAPALTWRPTERTSLTLLSSYQRMRNSDPGTLPVAGTLQANPNGKISRGRYLGEPDHDTYDSITTTIGYLFEHAFSDQLKLRHGVRSYHSELDYKYFLMAGWADAAQRRLNRQARWFDDDTSIFTTDTNLEYKLQTGIVEHTILGGVDYTKSKHASDRERGSLAAIDVYNPVYGAAFNTVPWRQFRTNQERTGFYLQDQMKIADKWVVLLGGRQDEVRLESLSLHSPADNTDEKERAFTARAGLVYLADNGVAPYFSYSESFEPTSGRDRLDARFKPTEGKQYEIGLRYQPPESNTLLTAAVYQLTRQNVLTPDPTDSTFSVQTGEARSRGLELEAKTSIGQRVDVIAAYNYTDARITKSNIASEVGSRLSGIPYHVASVWLDYKLDGWGLPGLLVGGGVRYVAEKPGNAANSILAVPDYTLFDARVSYDVGSWRYAMNAFNLADREYIPSVCLTGVTGCNYAAGRTINVSASYRW